MKFGFNDIGELLAGRGFPDGNVPLLTLGKNHPFLKEAIFLPDTNGLSAHFNAHGLERFIARRLANTWTQPVANACRMGEVCNRDLYYIDNPKTNFFQTHKGKVSVILGSNDAGTPDAWNGLAALLSELFYLDKNLNIHVSQEVFHRLLPPVKGRRVFDAKTNIQHERRAEWLQFFLHRLAPLVKDPNAPIDRPSFKEAMGYFLANFPGMPKNERTYRRDIQEMTGSEKANSRFDKTDNLITSVWNHITDRAYIIETQLIREIVYELGKIKADRGETTRLGSLPTGAWQKVRGEDRCELTAIVEPSL